MVDGYISSSMAAKHLGVSKCTLLRAVHRGEISAMHRTPGGQFRFHPDELAHYARQLRPHLAPRRKGDYFAGGFVRLAARAAPEPAARETAARAAAFAAVFDYLSCGVVIVDAAGIVTFMNEMARRASGDALDLTRPLTEQAEAFAIRPFTNSEGAPTLTSVETLIARALAGETVQARMGLVRLPGAGDRLLETSAVPLRDVAGEVRGAVSIFNDVTSRISAEQALRASESRFRNLYKHAPVGVALLDTWGRLLVVNPALRRILGYDEETLCRMTFADITHPDDVDADWTLYRELLAGVRDSYTMEKRYLHKDGHIVRGNIAVSAVRDRSGVPLTIIGVLADVTEGWAAEERLRQSETRYRRIVETAQEGIWQLDADLSTTYINQTMAEMLGYTVIEMQGHSLLAFVDAASASQVEAAMTRRARGDAGRGDVAFRCKDGGIIWANVAANALLDEEGRYMGALAMLTDVTDRKRAEASLQTSEKRFRALSEHATDMIGVINADGIIQYASPSYQTVLGYAPETIVGRRLFTIAHPDDVPALRTAFEELLLADGGVRTAEFRLRRCDNEWRNMEATAINRLADPAVQGIIVTTRDTTERRRAAAAVKDSEERFRAIFEQAAVGIAIETLDGCFLRVNDHLSKLLGYGRDELIGRSWMEVTHQNEIAADQKAMARLAGEPDYVYVTDKRYLHQDGHVVWAHLTLAPIRDAHGEPAYLVATIEDVGPRKHAEERLRYLALHDALTGLPNRLLLEEHLGSALDLARRTGGGLALLVLNLNRFKEVNDTFGHQHGDSLLRQIADRLSGIPCRGAVVARLGGDEFAVLVPGATAAEAEQLARAIGAAIEAPLYVGEQALHIQVSVGIALFPDQASDASTLLRHADVAMRVAEHDHCLLTFYDPGLDQYRPERLVLVGELRAAIASGALELHYQPQVAVGSARVCGVEALVRWPHPEQGLIPPDRFITLAEQTGLIAPLTTWVLGEAVRQCRAWQDAGLVLAVSVNLSMWDLYDLALPDRIARLLLEQGIPATRLRLELTEGTLMADPERTVAVLDRLHVLGVGLAVDDFGSGYSSLAYLKRLPVDELKIDKGFVRHLATDAADAAIVASTVALGHALGLRVVAEGIEDEAAWDQLAAMGCDVAQGYYLARPLPAEKLTRWLEESSWALE